ncbi:MULTISPECIES: hypothetical protein [Paenibacillus]|nr:hypothetical protein [Paenibacillus odorifer]
MEEGFTNTWLGIARATYYRWKAAAGKEQTDSGEEDSGALPPA